MELLLQHWVHRETLQTKIVSILVLMELLLQPETVDEEQEIKEGFNPCFNGTSTSTITEEIKAVNSHGFQSLF